MKSFRRKSIVLFLISMLMVFSLITFAGCDKKQKGKDKLNTITFSLDWTPNTNHTGIYVAKALGYYEKVGIKVNIIQPGDTGASPIVASGKQAQFGVDFQESMYVNYFSGIKVKAVAAILQHNTSGIISLKKDGINSPKDMVGKKHATWSLPVEQAIIEDLIEKDGGVLPADKSELYNTEYALDSVMALEANDKTKSNSAWVYEAWDLVKARQKDKDKYNYFSFKSQNAKLDWYTPVFIGNEKYMKNNPEITRAFLSATKKGYQYAIENPKEAAEILMEEVPELRSERDFIIASQKEIAKKYFDAERGERWGEIDSTRWEGFYEYLNSIKAKIEEKMKATEASTVLNEIPTNYGFTNEYLK